VDWSWFALAEAGLSGFKQAHPLAAIFDGFIDRSGMMRFSRGQGIQFPLSRWAAKSPLREEDLSWGLTGSELQSNI
jgi:hypothetical protein